MGRYTTAFALPFALVALGCASETPTSADAPLNDLPVQVARGTGTQRFAIPQEMLFDASGNLVGEVHVLVTKGWTNTPHSVDITITSVDGQPFHDHGHQVNKLADLEIAIDDGAAAQLVVPWTSDNEPKRIDDLYTVCAHLIFGDNHHGEESCTDFGPF